MVMMGPMRLLRVRFLYEEGKTLLLTHDDYSGIACIPDSVRFR